MPDQMPPPSQPYGPFTDVLTGPLSGQRQQVMQQPSGWGGQGAALANYANAFIKSAQVGQREKLERSEMEKASHERNFDSVHSYIQNSDTISLEGKQAAERAYLMGKFSQVANHASQGEKQNKDNPLFALTKAITGAVMGPGELKNHKDMAVDVNALLSIANDEQYKIDPRKMAADAGAGVADVLRGAAADQPGIAGGAALPQGASRLIAVPSMGSPDLSLEEYGGSGEVGPETGPATITGGGRPLAAQAPGESTPGKQLTQDEALRDPKIQGYLQGLAQQGISWDKDPYLSRLIGGLPKTGALKALGSAQPISVRNQDGTVSTRMQQAMIDPGTNTVHYIDLGLAGARPSASAGSLQHAWVKTPDGKTTVALFNARKPGGFVDFNGNAMPDGTSPSVPPTDGSGQNAVYRVIAKSELAKQGITEPTEAEIINFAGQIARQRMDVPLQKTQQDMAIAEQATGIGAGSGINAPRTTKPPTGGSRQTPPSPITSPNQQQGDGAQAPGLGNFPNQRALEDAKLYYNVQTGTATASGRTQPRAQAGMAALQAASGLGPAEFSAEMTDVKATNKALSEAINVAGAFGRVQETLKEHGKVLIDATKATAPDGMPLVNKSWQWIQQHIRDYPELQKYNIALAAVQREYARLISGGVQSKAMLPVSANEKGESVIRKDAPLGTILAAVQQLNTEADTEQKAFGQQQQGLKDRLAASPISKAFGGPTKPQTPLEEKDPVVMLTVTDKDGTHQVKTTKAKEAAVRAAIAKVQGASVK
tara:strand:- start:13615 stop:15915 length:2301 start_codon:yes stop_codon:yes gene_type:complete